MCDGNFQPVSCLFYRVSIALKETLPEKVRAVDVRRAGEAHQPECDHLRGFPFSQHRAVDFFVWGFFKDKMYPVKPMTDEPNTALKPAAQADRSSSI